MNGMYTVNEVAAISGVTVRALHYYDSIGLLPPDGTTDSGYRLYGRPALLRLQEIMFLRELEFPLKDIRELLDSPSYDRQTALAAQRTLLKLRADRTEGLIRLIDETLSGKKNIGFKEFDMKDINNARDKYREEAKARWGGTSEFKESERREAARTPDDRAAMDADAAEIFAAFAGLAAAGVAPASTEAHELVARWQAHITKHYYPCTAEILKGLGLMYSADERFAANLDAYGPGTARFMSDAIAAF